MRAKTKKSAVWDHFVLEKDMVRCNMCNTLLKYCGGTSTMKYHLDNRHRNMGLRSKKASWRRAVSAGEITHKVCRLKPHILKLVVISLARLCISYIAHGWI